MPTWPFRHGFRALSLGLLAQGLGTPGRASPVPECGSAPCAGGRSSRRQPAYSPPPAGSCSPHLPAPERKRGRRPLFLLGRRAQRPAARPRPDIRASGRSALWAWVPPGFRRCGPAAFRRAGCPRDAVAVRPVREAAPAMRRSTSVGPPGTLPGRARNPPRSSADSTHRAPQAGCRSSASSFRAGPLRRVNDSP